MSKFLAVFLVLTVCDYALVSSRRFSPLPMCPFWDPVTHCSSPLNNMFLFPQLPPNPLETSGGVITGVKPIPNLNFNFPPIATGSVSHVPNPAAPGGTTTLTGKADVPNTGVSLTGSVSQTHNPGGDGVPPGKPSGTVGNVGAEWKSPSGDTSAGVNVAQHANNDHTATLKGQTNLGGSVVVKGEHTQPLSSGFKPNGASTSSGTVEYNNGGLKASVTGTHTAGSSTSHTGKVGFSGNGVDVSVSHKQTPGQPSTNTGSFGYNNGDFSASVSGSQTKGQPPSGSIDVKIPIVKSNDNQGSVFLGVQSDLTKGQKPDHSVQLGVEVKM